MRISTLEHDTGYTPIAPQGNAYLNGKLLDHCVTADEDGGYVIVYDLDEDGHIRLDVDGEIKYKAKFGKVVIRFPKGMRKMVKEGWANA